MTDHETETTKLSALEPSEELVAIADINTHEKVLELLGRLPPGKLLDAPAGSGALAGRLEELGFSVTGAELNAPESLRRVSSEVIECDLNGDIPLPSASFDYVTCIEGIEHLENPFHLIREFARVLRPGGRLILTTPNTLVISSRLRFLLTGFFNKFPRPLDESRHDPSFHINPLTYQEVRFILRRNNFVIRTITTNRIKSKEWLAILLLPFIYPFTRLTLNMEQTDSTRQMNREVFRDMMSRSILFGQTLILVAQKED